MRRAVSHAATLLLSAFLLFCFSPLGLADGAVLFGILKNRPGSHTEFVETNAIPYEPKQAYGWIASVGPGKRSWTETLTLPLAPEFWPEGVTLSADKRTATTRGMAEPGSDTVFHFWTVAIGDPTGEYRMSVTFEDGTTRTFVFELRGQ